MEGLLSEQKARSHVFLSKQHHTVSQNTEINNKVGQLPVSINDLRDKEFSGVRLSLEEKAALQNFDTYRIQYLNSSSSEEEFSKRYLEMQAKANLASFNEFLKAPYTGTLSGN